MTPPLSFTLRTTVTQLGATSGTGLMQCVDFSSNTPKKNENQDSPVILILPYLGPEFKFITKGT